MQFSKGDDEKKNKHPGWSYDRKFTPLSQSREKILEYLLTKGTIVLPKVSEPPKMMGVNKEKLCKFHRAPGHDTEDCFVLKNIIQDLINKDLRICDDSTPEILRNPFPDHGKAAIATITIGAPLPYHPQEHIRPCIGNGSHKVMMADLGKKPLDFIAMMNNKTGSLPEKFPMIPKTFILQSDESTDGVQCYLDIPLLEERVVEGDWIQPSENQSITFSKKDLSKWRYFHEDALYIVVQINEMTVPHVLIDGGSGLNICPDLSAKALGIRTAKDKPLEEWMRNMEIDEPSGSAYTVSSNHASYQEHPLYVYFTKNPKGFQLLLKGGYHPFTGLGKNEDGILEPINMPFQMSTRGLGCHDEKDLVG
ncbi:hypothetical protein EJ110_NYTH55459 [Nymphaea thermarum]|nr:hypothetical protein EJ110_NYTH55459 [Nymphaea thermarum]